MADGECIIGGDVSLVFWKDGGWYADGEYLTDDIGKCKILPSSEDRKIVLSVGEPPRIFVPKKLPEPEPVRAIEKSSVQEVQPIAEVLQVVEDTILEKVLDKLGDNPLAVVVAIGFVVFKKMIEGKQTKSESEMDKRCSGRHQGSDVQTKELEKQVEDLKQRLEEVSSNYELSKSSSVSRRDYNKLLDRMEALENLLDNK